MAELRSPSAERLGKGRHAARCNLGDCTTHAAEVGNEPSRCLGDDHARTDLALA